MLLNTRDVVLDLVNDKVLVYVVSSVKWSDAVAAELVRIWHAHLAKKDNLRAIVVTDGGSPTSEHRSKIDRETNFKSVKTAVVTDSPIARFAVAALALLPGAKIKGAAPEQFGDLRKFLDLNADDYRAIGAFLVKVQATPETGMLYRVLNKVITANDFAKPAA
jgi:hypothetical protein